MTSFEGRTADHPVDKLFLERWSPRALSGEAMAQEDLLTLFEAARWAPSSYNSQPWRFLYAHRGTENFARFLDLLVPFNQDWAKGAAVLVIAVSKLTMSPRGEDMPSHTHAYDSGAAWASLAFQATMMGWHTHGMTGLDMSRAEKELGVPDGYRVECAIAIGRRGDKSTLPEQAQAMEVPNGRNPVASFAFQGNFPVA